MKSLILLLCCRLTPDWRPFPPWPTCLTQAHAWLEAFLTSTDTLPQAHAGPDAFHNITDTFVSGESELYTHTHIIAFLNFNFHFLVCIIMSLHSHIWCCRLTSDWRPFSPQLTCLTQDHAGLEAFSHHNWQFVPGSCWTWCLSVQLQSVTSKSKLPNNL